VRVEKSSAPKILTCPDQKGGGAGGKKEIPLEPNGFKPLDLSMVRSEKFVPSSMATRYKTSLFEAPAFRYGVLPPAPFPLPPASC